MRRPLRKLVAVCLLLLVVVSPRPADRRPPTIAPAPSPQMDWSPLHRALDEQRWNASVWLLTIAEHRVEGNIGAQRQQAARSGGAHRGYATAKECASMVEHGGSYDESSNPTHKGRYQFSRPTWIAFGGDAAHWDDWDLATPAEQDEVFERAWSSPSGPNNWLPYDGCG